MNITCALSSSQIKGLFQYVYKTMTESLAENKIFNADDVMKNLFDKIEKTKNADTAAKFLQIVPQMIGTASYQTSLINLEFDPKSDPRKLAQKFMNSETGLLDVLQYFRPKDIIKEIQNDVNIKNNSINSPKFTEDTDVPVSPRYKASSAFTTTMQQFITKDPNDKLTIEEINPDRVRIYNTIEKLKVAFNTKGSSVLNPTYQGRVLNLKGVRLDSIAVSNMDKTTAALLAKGNSIAAKESGVNFLKDAIVLMVTDEFGTPINFSEEGNITSKEEGGKPVYQFLRNVTVDKETGDYTVKDIYGKEERIQSVDDLVADYAKNAYKTSLETFKKKYKEDYEETYQVYKEQQQADFKALLDIHKEILKEKEKLFDIMDISAGIPLDFTGGNMPLNDFLKLSDNLNTDYKFTTLRTERDLIGAGNTVISINGYDIPVDRKNMSKDLVNKIAAALVNTDMTDIEKYNFYDQFSHNNINFNDKKLFVVYKPESGLEVSYKEDAKNPERKIVDLTDKEIAKAIIIKALGTERKSSKGDFYAANMKINADLLEKSAQFFDYDLVNDEPVPASYREFLSKVNPTVKFKNNEPGVYNSYFAFRVNDKLSKELKKAKEKVEEKKYTTTDSYIRQAKDALLAKLKGNENISGTVIGGLTPTTFTIQVEGKSVQGRFEEGLSITSVPKNNIVTFSVGDKVEDGKLLTDVISIYAGDKKIGQVSETDYKAEEKPRTYADAVKADDKANNPVGVPQPSDKKSKRSGISKLWDRSSKLPSDVTREEVDAAQEWWENSPLSKFIELEHMANIVNSDVYARFVISGKRLEDTKIQLDTATGGSAVDLYHEAWHAFSQLYLTKDQKTKLYAETRKRLNNNDLTPLEVEEKIAEEFRTYAKNPKPTGDAPIRNTLFRKIWNFIKALFGKRNTKDELFEKLFFASKNPKLLNKYAPLVDNAMFDMLNRDRGILNVETKELELSFQDSMTVSSQIDSALSELIDEIYTDRVEREKQGEVNKNNVPIKATRNGTISLLTNDKDKAIAYKTIYERFEDNLAYFQDQLDTADEDDYNKVTLLTDKVRILKAAIENWGDSKSGVVKFHIDNSTFDLIKQNYIEIESEDEVDEDKDNSAPETAVESEKHGNKEVGDKSLLQLAEKETLYIIKSLFKIADGKQVMGKLGFPELADFSRTWNIVTKVIGGEKDPVKMYKKLVAGIESFPELKQLIENKIPDPREIHNIEEFNIKAAFWQDFKKTKLKYLQLTVDNQDGNGYSSEVTEASIEFTNIISKFKSEFKASPKSTYINKGDDNKSILNLNKVIADFDTGTFDSRKSIQFARAIGINLQDLSALKRELDYNKDDYGIQYLFDVTKSIHKISKDPNASTEHKNFIKKFLSDPIGALYGQIPKGIHEKATSEKNIIQKLAKLQSAFGTNYSSFSVLNPEKNLVNEFIEDNTVSMIVDAINNVSSGNALWTSDEYQYMSYLNPEINGFTLQSQILKNIFEYSNNTLNERKGDAKIELAMVAGSQIVDEKGANTTSLDVQSKYIQELNMMLKGGIVEFMRHASKSSSFGMRLANGVSGGLGKANVNSKLYVDIDMFGPNGNADQYAVNNIFIGYIQAELTRIQKFKGNKELFKQYNGYNRNVGTKENPIYAGEQFTAFDNVLKDFTTTIDGKETTTDLKQYLIDNVKDGDLKNYLKSNPEIKKAITEQVTKYFNGQADKNYKQFSDSPFYDPALMNRLNVFTTLEEEDKHKLLVKAYTMNAWIHNFETASLVYGDIVQYNHAKQELHKRNTGSTSGGRGFMDDIYTQQFLNSDLIKKTSYAFKLANKAGYGADYNTFNYSNKYNTAIMQDVSRNSVYLTHIEKGLRDDYVKRGVEKDEIEKRIAKEIDKYNRMEEGDGQGFIAIDAYRNLRLAEKSWSADQEKLFQDIINEKEIKAEDVVRFFPVYKLQHFGHLANTMLPVNAMHKFALMPLIPSMIKGSDLESLHHQMMKSNIQYATFQTGSKVGSVTSQLDKNGKAVADQIYDDNGVEKTLKSDIKFTPNTIYLANLKNVTAVPTKYKGKTVFSTQLRKLILEGLYQDGEIVNKDYAPYIKAYETAINDYTDLLKTELLEEIGYEKVNGKYVSGDISKFMDVVQRELERKDLPEHLIKYIQVGKDNKITKDLSLHLLADDIEKILVSLVEKRIVKQKVKGEALVQVASSMSNGLWDSGFKFDKANTKDIEKYLGSNNLPFYHPESINLDVKYKDYTKEKLTEVLKRNKGILADQAQYYTDRNESILRIETDYIEAVLAGKKPKVTSVPSKTNAMKVAIALQGDFKNLLKLNHNDKQPIGTIVRLNEMIKNDEWLNKGNNRKAITMTAVRIPVQGLNSMEFMEVYHFLDPAAGNIIIPPSEIVAKSGADFDVDKLTTFMPNIDAEGHYIETSMDAKKLETKINAAKKSGDKGEMKRLIKMQKAALENRLIDSIRGILELPDNYATLVRPNDTYLLKDIADELVESSPEYKEFKTISPTNTLEVGYNLAKHDYNMVGKDVLGIIALENALHPLLTSLGAALPKTYKHQTWDDENKRYIEVPEIDYEMRLLLNHNKTSDGRISLSKINSSDNQDKIADLISHLMNGSVDVEKDAWIFFIQANTEIVPVLLSLLKAGVPKREAIYFVSQPLVKEYARQQRLIGSAFANVTDNGVSANENEKYIALQNTLAVSGISFRYPYLSRDASNLKMFDALKSTKDNVKVKFKDGTFKVFAPKELLKAIANNTIKKNNISDIYNAVVKYKLDEDGIPELDDYGKNIQIPLYKKVSESHLLSNDNWYYVTQVLTKDVNKFSQAELKTNIDNNDFTSDSAIKAFLHFVEFEKEIKGLSNLKRQANPDTKTSKTIQEVTQKSLSLDEAADSSKIEPELARKLQEESILGTFFDKMIITDVVSPLFNVTNNKNVSDHMVKTITRKGGKITTKFGEGKDGVEAYITAYKNAIVNYIYQNKLNKIISTEESFPGIPESFTDIDSKEYIDNFMAMLSENSYLKELYPILEQITDIPVRSKKDGEVTYTTTLTLNNKSVVKGALAEAYHQNLLDLADDNIIKVNDPEQNKEISDMFKMLPLMSILQNGVGSTKYGLSYVLPDTTFFEIIEPASREFLALNSELKDKTLDIIDNLLFDNGVGENNYILSRASRKASNLSEINVDEEVEDEEYVPKGVASASGQGMTFGTQQSTSVKPESINNVKEMFLGLKLGTFTFTVGESEYEVEPKKNYEGVVRFNIYKYNNETKLYNPVINPKTKRSLLTEEANNFLKNYLPKDYIDFIIDLSKNSKSKLDKAPSKTRPGKMGTIFNSLIDAYLFQIPVREMLYGEDSAPILLTLDEVNKKVNELYSSELISGIEKYLKPFVKDQLIKDIENIYKEKINNKLQTYLNDLEAALKNFETAPTTQPSTSVEVISEPYGVVVAETKPNETKTQEFVNIIQPQIQSQAYKENASGTANDMFMYGLRWTRKGKAIKPLNNKSYANKGLPITDALAKDGYVYDTVDQNGNTLAPLSDLQPIINEIQDSLGIDMSNYDAVIGNIYLPGQNIATHRDTTESLSARNYPVVVYTIGNNSGIGIYENEKNPGSASFASDKKTTIPTKNGTIYTFGMNGKGRFEVAHDTPKGIKRDQKYPPITLPNGDVVTNYTITLTFRRAADLEPGMPSTPAKLGTQQQDTPVNKQVRIKKVIPNTIVDKSQGYTFNLQELNEVKRIFENTNPFNTDPLDSETIKDGRVFEDPSLREYGMSDQQYSWAKNNESILSKLNELLYTDEYSAVTFEDLISMLIDDNTKLVDTAQTSLFDDESTQQQAPVGELTEEDANWLYDNGSLIDKTYGTKTLFDAIDPELKIPITLGDTTVTAIEPNAGGKSHIWFKRPTGNWLMVIDSKSDNNVLTLAKMNDIGVYNAVSLSKENLKDTVNKAGLKDLIRSIYNDTNIKLPSGRKNAFETQNSLQQKYGIKRTYKDIVNALRPVQQESSISETQEKDNTVTYKPIGKEKQTYTVVNNQIFNKNDVEVFKEASTDRNKILANFAVKQGRAVVVEHKSYKDINGNIVPSKYIVNNRDIIISGTTGKVMQWDENNGDRKAIIALAKKKFAAESNNKYYQLDTKEALEPALEELDKYLLDFLKPFGVKSKQFDELKSKLGVDALGATDVLNKLIWYTKNRNAETVPEEVGHMVTMLMGETNPIIKDLLESVTDWSEYDKIYKQYMPIYNNVKQVKIEAVGKLIAKSLVKNYKVSGTDKTLLAKALAAIEEFIEKLFGRFKNNFLAQMEYSENLADHIALNILMGDKDYIAKLNTSFEKLDYDKALKGNEFAQDIIKTFTDLNGKLTGSLAVAGQGDTIYRSSEEPIHDIDFNVKSIEEYETMLEKVESINGVPYHYGWDNAQKDYTTYAFLIPKDGYTIEVLERDFERGNGWVTQYNVRDKNGNIVEKTSKNHVAVDFFVYKRGEDKSSSSGIFKTTNDIFKGKLTLAPAGNNERLFQRTKDQQDYVLSQPTSYNEVLPEFTYYQLNEEPEINQDMEAFNAEVTKQGKLPTEFIVDQRKWVLNNMKLYDLVDKSTGMMFMKNMNMFTGAQVQEIPSNKPVNKKQLINFTKQLSSGITSYRLDQILAVKGISIEDVYNDISKVTTQSQLNDIINKILKAIC